jgi:hypothetical protein
MNAFTRSPLPLLLLLLPIAAGAQETQGVQENSTLSVQGLPGEAPVIQSKGRSYVDVEGLARITRGTLGFRGSRIVLTLPQNTGARGAPPPRSEPPSPPPPKPGFSKDFLRASIEAMTVIREWRSAIDYAVRSNNPVSARLVSPYYLAAQSKMALAASAATSDSDRNTVPLLQSVFGKMQSLSDRFVQMNESVSYVRPDALDNDPLDQQILACAQGLGAMEAGGQFEDVPTCH